VNSSFISLERSGIVDCVKTLRIKFNIADSIGQLFSVSPLKVLLGRHIHSAADFEHDQGVSQQCARLVARDYYFWHAPEMRALKCKSATVSFAR
jgi:hypothetical protein